MSRVVKKYQEVIAFHPGYYLKELINDFEMTQEEFAKRMDVEPKVISELVNANQNMTLNIADKIASLTGMSVDVWINLQKEYDKKVLEIERREQLEEERQILRQIDSNYIREIFKIKKFSRDVYLKIKKIRELLKVSSLTVLKKPDLIASFRNPSGKMEDKNVINSNIMLQIAKEKAKSIETAEFDKNKLKKELRNIKMLNLESPDVFYKKLLDILNSCGIVLILLPHLKNSGINGAVTKIGKDKIMLLLSDRNKFSDIFWFSLFHEIGHIINGDYKVSISKDIRDEYEEKADEFAANILIDKQKFEDFVKNNDFSEKAIRQLSKNNDIQPGILLGRLQSKGYVDYAYLNNLKIKYKIQA